MNLLELAEAGDVPGVLRALGELTPDQRADHAPALAAHFAALEAQEWRTLAEERRIALSTARLGCQVTPPTAADCILSPGFRAAFSADWMVDVLDLYPAAWQAEVVARIDERATGTVMDGDRYAIIDYLVRVTGCPAPTATTYLNSWIRYWDHSALRTGKRSELPRYGDMARILRDHHCAATFLPLILERPDVQLPPVSVLMELADEGLLDRAALVHRVLTEMADLHPAHALRNLEALRLTPEEHARTSPERVALLDPLLIRVLQDGTRKEITPHLALLRGLGLSAREQVSFLRDHVAMLDLSLPVAEYGQQVLVALDEAGLLEDGVLAESCERVLARPEKKLVRAQFSWLDRAARRDPGRAAGVVTGVALAFQHPDIALRERALTVAARHLRAAGEAVLPELRVAAASLGPGLTARAEELFGPPPGDDGTAGRSTEAPPAALFADVLPAVPVPAPVRPVGAAAEVATEVAAVLADPDAVVSFERALDGLVRHARLDRAILSETLGPVVRREPNLSGLYGQSDLYDVAAAVRGDEPREWHIHLREDQPAFQGPHVVPGGAPAEAMLKARLTEAIDLIEAGTQPFLLALPTDTTGAIDAAVLVERIAELEGLGVVPVPADLGQAVLRVTPAPDGPVRRAAEELRSDAGRLLARWLAEGGLPHQDSTPPDWPVDDPLSAAPGWWHSAHPRSEHDAPLPPLLQSLPPVAAMLVSGRKEKTWPYHTVAAPFWAAQLPHHRDEVAARLPYLPTESFFPLLVESGGPAGFATHWHIGDQLRRSGGTVVDALLTLAAQGQLDSTLLAGQLQARIRHGLLPVGRAVAGLRAAAETGAWATVWSIVEAVLPALLRGTPVRGAAELLAFATECAGRCGAKGAVPEVDALAARPASSKTVKNARHLREVLR
ncbi:hypothetical protein KVH31_30190 [Streptomyces olivaceus]|uniref:hypothetical protein n=1 Tax=Streptomyces olivaceus TaxID=47716 RepID=UPI001CD03D7F|nr:hypothetical protein [Streptomyces olivaceus]MBZ6210770.1 hypothetical protein [Streptomyces olivaceus]